MNFYQKLEQIYLKAPVNELYKPEIVVTYKKAEISISVNPQFFHAADSLHGSVYFKMLDDAAFFAAQSVVEDVFVLTAKFNIQLLKPVKTGVLKATGMLIDNNGNKLTAKAYLYNDGVLVAIGEGVMMRSEIDLNRIFTKYGVSL
jgi:uncharacterized protein (TIGR00369 family)